MPISSADVQQAIADGLTRQFSFTDTAPTGGVDGDWAAPGPSNSRGVYRRRSGVWAREVGQHTGLEIVNLLEARVGAARLDATAVKNLPSGMGITFVSQGLLEMVFDDRTWKSTGINIPADATLIQVVSHLERIRGSWIRNAGIWRTIPPATEGEAAVIANEIVLETYSFVGNFSIGRRAAGESVLLAYDGGFAGLAGANVEVLTA